MVKLSAKIGVQVKIGIFDEIQTKRDLLNLEPLSKSTYYRKVDQTLLSQYSYEIEYRWFESQKITILFHRKKS
jgi:hypothetical protein